jgi:hypothetical protein
VQPIANAVERIRGISFARPVTIEFLGEKAFAKRSRAGFRARRPPRARLEEWASGLRALGYTNATDDELIALTKLDNNAEGVRAWYDPLTKSIVARQSDRDLGITGRVILAHELTHALDDQKFSFDRLGRSVTSATEAQFLQTLIEGNATYVMRRYLLEQSAAEQRAYFSQQQRLVEDVTQTDLPSVVGTQGLLPYTMGQWLPALLDAGGGHRAVNDAFRDPPRSGIEILDPKTYLDDIDIRDIRAPAPDPGDKRVGTSSFGANSLFLFLSSRIDPVVALGAADAWAGGQVRELKRNGHICDRIAFSGTTPDATATITAALAQWGAAMPPGAVVVDPPARAAGVVTVTACDPGDAATAPSLAADTAMSLPIVRNALVVNATKAGASLTVAECAADRVVSVPAAARTIIQDAFGQVDLVPRDAIDIFALELRNATADCNSVR